MKGNLIHKQEQLDFLNGISIDLQCNIELKDNKVYFHGLHIFSNKNIDIPNNVDVIDRGNRWKLCKPTNDGKLIFFNNEYSKVIIKKLEEWAIGVNKVNNKNPKK